MHIQRRLIKENVIESIIILNILKFYDNSGLIFRIKSV